MTSSRISPQSSIDSINKKCRFCKDYQFANRSFLNFLWHYTNSSMGLCWKLHLTCSIFLCRIYQNSGCAPLLPLPSPLLTFPLPLYTIFRIAFSVSFSFVYTDTNRSPMCTKGFSYFRPFRRNFLVLLYIFCRTAHSLSVSVKMHIFSVHSPWQIIVYDSILYR